MARLATPRSVTAGRDQAASTTDLRASEDLAANMGMWSSLAAAVVLGLSMAVFVLVGPWKDLRSYAAHAGDWKYIGIWVLFFLLALFFVPAVAAVHAVTPEAFFLQGIATLVLAPVFGGGRLMNAIKWLFILNGVNTAAGLVMISVTSLASPSGQTLYTATVLAWGIVLTVALLLLAVAFRRRLLLGFHDRKTPQPATQ